MNLSFKSSQVRPVVQPAPQAQLLPEKPRAADALRARGIPYQGLDPILAGAVESQPKLAQTAPRIQEQTPKPRSMSRKRVSWKSGVMAGGALVAVLSVLVAGARSQFGVSHVGQSQPAGNPTPSAGQRPRYVT